MFKNKQFPNEIEKYPKDNTYFLIAFEKKIFLKNFFFTKKQPSSMVIQGKKNKKLCCNNFCTPRHLSHIIVTRWKVIFAKRLHSTLKMGKKSNNKCSHKSVVFQKTLINFFFFYRTGFFRAAQFNKIEKKHRFQLLCLSQSTHFFCFSKHT